MITQGVTAAAAASGWSGGTSVPQAAEPASTAAVIVGALLAAAPHATTLIPAGVPVQHTSTRAIDARLASITGSVARGLPASSTAATTAAIDRTPDRPGSVELRAAAARSSHHDAIRPGALVEHATAAFAAQSGLDPLRAAQLIGVG
jgi:hypothetical protein